MHNFLTAFIVNWLAVQLLHSLTDVQMLKWWGNVWEKAQTHPSLAGAWAEPSF